MLQHGEHPTAVEETVEGGGHLAPQEVDLVEVEDAAGEDDLQHRAADPAEGVEFGVAVELAEILWGEAAVTGDVDEGLAGRGGEGSHEQGFASAGGAGDDDVLPVLLSVLENVEVEHAVDVPADVGVGQLGVGDR